MAKIDIKTVAKKNIRTIETVGIITEKVKDAGIKTKDDIGKAINTDADTAEKWAVSQDFSKIQVGATVYGYSSSQFGHVGIYIGNGKVIHNLSGTVKVQSLESWVKDFKGFAWGWENGENLI